jgi:hypothetical protein
VGDIHSGFSDDKELIAVDNDPGSQYYGRLYCVWTHFDAGGNIHGVYSDDGGVTWTTPQLISPSSSVQGAWPVVAPGGTVYVAWVNFGSSVITIRVAESTDGGASWTLKTNPATDKTQPQDSAATSSCFRAALNGNIRYLPSPQIAVGPDGALHIVYSYKPTADDEADVWADRVPVSTDFLVLPSPSSLSVCAPDDAVFTVEVPQFESFDEEVALTTGTLPTGMTHDFTPGSVTPPGSSTLTLTTAGVAPGTHTVDVTGTSSPSAVVHDARVSVEVFAATASAPTPVSPADGATGVANVPSFTWTADPTAVTTTIEVASDAGFASIVETLEVTGTGTSITTSLTSEQQYWWRLRSTNPCGDSANSAVFTFTVRAIPPILLVDDDDADDVRSYYTDILDAMGRDYDIWDTANSDNEPSAVESSPYQVIIWFTGDEFGGFAGPSGASESELDAWMANGGCFLISSQDYYYDRGLTPFMTNRLGLLEADSDTNQTTVTGVGSVFGSIESTVLSYPVSNFSDTFTPSAEGTVAFTGDQGTAAVQLETEDGLGVFLGFPLEAMDSVIRDKTLEAFFVACETTAVFSDGFESGDWSEWSDVVPPSVP